MTSRWAVFHWKDIWAVLIQSGNLRNILLKAFILTGGRCLSQCLQVRQDQVEDGVSVEQEREMGGSWAKKAKSALAHLDAQPHRPWRILRSFGFGLVLVLIYLFGVFVCLSVVCIMCVYVFGVCVCVCVCVCEQCSSSMQFWGWNPETTEPHPWL